MMPEYIKYQRSLKCLRHADIEQILTHRIPRMSRDFFYEMPEQYEA